MLVEDSSLNKKLEAYTVFITFVFTSGTIFQFATPNLVHLPIDT